MNLSEYQAKAMRTNDGKATDRLADVLFRHSHFEGPTYATEMMPNSIDFGGVIMAALGLSGEVGEFNDMIKKWVYHGTPIDEEHIKKELGDVLWYVAMMADAFGWSLDDIGGMNIDKLLKRYPQGFSEERSNNRGEGDV